MKALHGWAAAAFLCVLQYSWAEGARDDGEVNKKGLRKRPASQEADEDAAFAAAMLGLVYDRVRDVGNVCRVVGDTAGAVAGGSIKAVGATVNGLSSVIDAASRNVDAKPKSVDNQSSLQPSSAVNSYDLDDPNRADAWDAPSNGHETRLSATRVAEEGPVRGGTKSGDGRSSKKRSGSAGSSDPFDRVQKVARSSLSGSLKFVSAAVRGVGDAVFQAGTVAEELAGGTGQVAEELVRVLQEGVGFVRDDMSKPKGKGRKQPLLGSGRSAASTDQRGESQAENLTSSSSSPSSSPPASATASASASATVAGVLTILRLWNGTCTLFCSVVEAVIEDTVALFRRKNGAPPPAPRLAVFTVLLLWICNRYIRRRRGRRKHPPPPSPRALIPTEAVPETPQGDLSARSRPPETFAPVAAGLSSPSRSLFPGPQDESESPSPAMPPPPPGSPMRRNLAFPDGLDPSLPSPAQVRAAQVRSGDPRVSLMRGLPRRDGRGDAEGTARVGWRWWPHRGICGVGRGRRGGRRNGRGRGGNRGGGVVVDSGRLEGGGDAGARLGVGRYLLWIFVLWWVASVLEERERDRLAWLAWDEGFREGQASMAVDHTVEGETTAWLNYMIGSMWGGERNSVAFNKRPGVAAGRIDDETAALFPLDGLSSFVSEQMAKNIFEALEESKPMGVVDLELQDVKLGSSAPQVIGIKMLDPNSSAAPGWGDGRCTHPGECLALRMDLQVATEGLRLGVGVKFSSLEKALLPKGTVRLLELCFRGSVSVRVELKKEFPFVSTALVALDGDPNFQVRMEQWGLDAFTLGAVDEWARLGLRQALKPFVLPGFFEVDAADALCPECAEAAETARAARKAAGDHKQAHTSRRKVAPSPLLPFYRLPSAAAAAAAARKERGDAASASAGSRTPRSKDTSRGVAGGHRWGRNGRAKSRNKTDPGKSKKDRHSGVPAVEAEGGEGNGKRELPSPSPLTGAPDRGSKGVGQRGAGKRGRADASQAGRRSGRGGPVQWLKDHVASKIIAKADDRGEVRSVMDWDGMD